MRKLELHIFFLIRIIPFNKFKPKKYNHIFSVINFYSKILILSKKFSNYKIKKF